MVLYFALIFATSLYCALSQSSSIVQTKYGPIEGEVTPLGRVFRSIPYATPPVGDLRWTEPIPPTPWTSVLNTTKDPPACIQECSRDHEPWRVECGHIISDDCLYLNVYTPPIKSEGKKVQIEDSGRKGIFNSQPFLKRLEKTSI